MPDVKMYVRSEDWDAYQSITDKPKWLHDAIRATINYGGKLPFTVMGTSHPDIPTDVSTHVPIPFEEKEDAKRYAVVIEMTGQLVKADMSREEADEFVRTHDINGEMQVVESKIKQSIQSKKGKRK